MCPDCGQAFDDHIDMDSVMRLQRSGGHVSGCGIIVPRKQWDRYTKFSTQELDEINRNKRKARKR